jgi:cyanophycin synthetase
MRMTTKAIAEQALARGWGVWLYYAEGSHLRVKRKDGKELELYSAAPPTVSFIATNRSNDKYFTTVFLRDQGMPVPETYLVAADDTLAAVQAATSLFASGKRCVVKPLDAAHGNGITVAIDDEARLLTAVAGAKAYADKIIIQEYFADPIDVRIACIDYKFAAALVRIPARVQGDGERTVSELIDITNTSSKRGKGYVSEMNVIPKANAEAYLEDAIHQVPAAGEWVQVVGTANVGTGGESMDVTGAIPAWLARMAEETARAMELPVCGVDFLLAGQPSADSTLEQLKPVIIELNHCPALFMHESPVHGKPQPVVAAYLDYLETI